MKIPRESASGNSRSTNPPSNGTSYRPSRLRADSAVLPPAIWLKYPQGLLLGAAQHEAEHKRTADVPLRSQILALIATMTPCQFLLIGV